MSARQRRIKLKCRYSNDAIPCNTIVKILRIEQINIYHREISERSEIADEIIPGKPTNPCGIRVALLAADHAAATEAD